MHNPKTIILGKPINLNPTPSQSLSGKFQPPTIQLNKSLSPRAKRKRKRLVKTVKVLAGTAGVLGVIAFPATAFGAVKGFGRFALRNPFKTVFVGGLASTRGGRKLIKGLPKQIFKGGEAVGKVAGGEGLGFGSLKDALITAGLIGAGAFGIKKVVDVITSKKKDKDKSIGNGGVTGAPLTPESAVVATGAGISATPAPGSPQTTQSAPVIAEIPKETVAVMPKVRPINIKIRNQPQINIALAV